jgi:hypothetical protein
MRILPLLLCLLAGATAHAQETTASDAPLQASAPLDVEEGDLVQVHREKGVLEGRLLETSGQFLMLGTGLPGAGRERILLNDVLELSVRKRSYDYGILVGGGIGVLGGILIPLAACDFGRAAGECVLFTLVGGAGAGLALGALGAFIGLAIPRWELLYDRILHGPLVLPSIEAREELREGEPLIPLAQIGLLASSVLTIAEPADAFGAGARVEVLAQLGPHIAVGPEVAFHYLFESLDRRPLNTPLASFGVLMRASPRPSELTPSVLVGFSVHTEGQPVTYSVGVGADWAGIPGIPLALELRWHQFNVPWKDGRQLTLGAGTRLDW